MAPEERLPIWYGCGAGTQSDALKTYCATAMFVVATTPAQTTATAANVSLSFFISPLPSSIARGLHIAQFAYPLEPETNLCKKIKCACPADRTASLSIVHRRMPAPRSKQARGSQRPSRQLRAGPLNLEIATAFHQFGRPASHGLTG
jgi:hypothetical protein